jgi:mono/diheme cytochrome c family protein
MPAFADVISPAETAAVIEHIKSAWPEEIRNRQAALTRSYEEKEE